MSANGMESLAETPLLPLQAVEAQTPQELLHSAHTDVKNSNKSTPVAGSPSRAPADLPVGNRSGLAASMKQRASRPRWSPLGREG